MRHIATSGGDQFVGQQIEQPADINAVYHNEKTDEKENGDPLHVTEGLMNIVRGLLVMMGPVIEQHQQGSAEHSDAGGLKMQRARQDKGDHNHRQNYKRLLEQPPVEDGIGRIHRHHSGFGFVRSFEILTPDKMNYHRLHHHDDHDHWRQVKDEIVEG